MIIFDQLRISDDGRRLYINAHVNKADYFKNRYIDSITIMTSEKVSETAPGTPNEDYIFTKKIGGEEKEINMVLTATDFTKTWETDPKAVVFKQKDMSRTLFFVYIKCKGIGGVDTNTPCRLDEETTLGVTFDENILHQKVMDYAKGLVKECCEIPLELVDFILLWNTFKSAVETEHYIAAIRFFKMMFDTRGDSGSIMPKGGCGCHG